MRALGARVLRREDARLLRGGGRYISDFALPGQLHAAFVRSTSAHANLLEVGVAAAREVPGVIAVFTAADLAGHVKPLRAISRAPGYRPCNTPILADEKVRTIGEPIALVVADDRYHAEDGAAVVTVSYEPLPALLTIDEALAEGAPAIHAEAPENLFNCFEQSIGDVEGAFAQADEVIELKIKQQRYCSVPIETRVVLASFDPAMAMLTVWLSTQVPHIARTGL